MDTIAFRAAGAADAPALARLHDHVWQQTMAGIAAPDIRAALDGALRLRQWTRHFSEAGPDDLVLMAETADGPVGMGAAGASRHAALGGRGEIRCLYVGPAFQGRGIGRALVAGLAGHLGGCGYDAVALSVVRENAPALAFYRALGGVEVGRYTDPGPVWRSEDVVIAWDNVRALIAAAGPAPHIRM